MRSSSQTLVVASLLCSSVTSSARAANAPAANAPQELQVQKLQIQEPSVSVLNALLGHKIEDETVQNFVKAQHLQKYAKGDSGGYDRPNDSTESFALLFRGNVISHISIYTRPIKGAVSSYRGTLPFGVKATDSPSAIRKRFGKARYDIIGKYANEPGSGWLVYDKGATKVTFSFTHNKMDEIYLDAPGKF